ncbi:Gti1/Pac2 family protein [Zalerion maritima]|uniref:Gti1/Pac2 family protein n=1 Tax=Zalerion maritima TaxID=339359 RepID=A0AAD5RG35_9PEZI|nr:Gti1/Pac2 family protein [Zalerion maritima]
MTMMETYHGQIRTPADAIKLFEACRLGLLPRVQRRLSEKERGAIRSGSVFVWDEREAGMRRWTDGKSWSASRVSGSFLTYREMEGKRGSGFGGGRRNAGKTPDSGRGSDEDHDDGEPEGYRYKADGLLKQSFSITTQNGQHLHLISYYSRPHGGQQDLTQPTNDAGLRHITPVKGLYPESSLQDSNPTPALTRAPMINSTYTISQAPQQVPAYAYHTQYAAQHQGYGWPPSPAVTPPYSMSHHVPGYPPHHAHPIHTTAPQQPAMYQAVPPGHALPPPSTQPRTTLAPYQPHTVSPHISQVRPIESPRGHHPAPAASPHAHQMPTSDPRTLPAIGPMSSASTPPLRAHSVSPPRSSHSDTNTSLSVNTSNKTSISSLLHATPNSSEPSSANPINSASSSPRTMISNNRLPPIVDHEPGFSEDARTRNLLNKKFIM